jgi:hypothetical protein
MKVSDFQKYLRALADAIATRTPSQDLTEAANALTPFAHYKMDAFAAFLKAAEAKYGESGELPDGKPPKPRKVSKPKPTKAPKPTPEAFSAVIADLKLRLERNEPLDRAAVTTEVLKFEKLTQNQIDTVMKELGFPAKVKGKPKALDAIVTHVLAARTAADRADV